MLNLKLQMAEQHDSCIAGKLLSGPSIRLMFLHQTFEIALWLPRFDDVDEACERLAKMDVQFPCGAPQTFDFGIRKYYIADPEGNLLEIGSMNQ